MKRKVSCGFTFFEVLIVVVIMVVLAGTAVPSFGRFYRGRELSYQGKRLFYILRYAKMHAVIHRRNMVFFIEPRKGQYRLEVGPCLLEHESFLWEQLGGSGPCDGDTFPSGLNGSFYFEKGIRVETDRERIGIYPDGSFDSARINLCRGADCRRIMVGYPSSVSILEAN